MWSVQFDKMYTVYLEHFDKQRMIKVSAVSAKVGFVLCGRKDLATL